MESKTPVLHTTADLIIELVNKKEKISVEDLAASLKVPVKTVQSLVDFLVEEKKLGIEYKFTTPYVYKVKQEPSKNKSAGKAIGTLIPSKEEFYKRASEKNLPYQRIEEMWNKYLEDDLKLKEEFYKKARQKKIPEESIEKLWKKYLTYI